MNTWLSHTSWLRRFYDAGECMQRRGVEWYAQRVDGNNEQIFT